MPEGLEPIGLPVAAHAEFLDPRVGGWEECESAEYECENDVCTKEEFDRELDGTPMVRESDAIRIMTSVMEETGIESASMLVKGKKETEKFTLTLNPEIKQHVLNKSLFTNSTSVSVSGWNYPKPLYVPKIQFSECSLTIAQSEKGPTVAYRVTEKGTRKVLSENTIHVPHSLTSYMYIFASSIFPGASSWGLDFVTLIEEDTNTRLDTLGYSCIVSYKAVESYCKAWNITQEEQELCKQVVDKAHSLGLSVGGRVEEIYVGPQATIKTFYTGRSILSRIGEGNRHYLSMPFFVLSHFSNKERHLFLNDLLKMSAKTMDFVLAKLMVLRNDYAQSKTIDRPDIEPFTFESYLEVLRNLPRTYLSDMYPGLYNNSIANVSVDGRNMHPCAVTMNGSSITSGQERQWLNTNALTYYPVPRLSTYPVLEFNKLAMCALLTNPNRDWGHDITDDRERVRENDKLFSFLRDPSLESAYKDFAIHVKGEREAQNDGGIHGEMRVIAAEYLDTSIIKFMRYLLDGAAIFTKYGTKYHTLPITGSVKNQLKKAIHNHNVEAAMSLDTKLAVAGIGGEHSPMPCMVELHAKVEKYRVKSALEVVTLGKALGHCIGNYATTSTENHYLLFRYKTACARVTKDFKEVCECYDAKNKVTTLSKALTKFLEKSIRIHNGGAPTKKRCRPGQEVDIRAEEAGAAFVNVGEITYTKNSHCLNKIVSSDIDNTLEAQVSKMYIPESFTFED